MKSLLKPGVGIALVACLSQAPMAMGQDASGSDDVPDFFGIPTGDDEKDTPNPEPDDTKKAEPKEPRETLQERRDRHNAERQAETLADMQTPIRKVQAMIDAGQIKPAFKGANEIRRRVGEPRQVQVEVLLAQLALIDDKPKLAVDFLEPFVGQRDKFEASQFDTFYFHAVGMMKLAAQPDKEQRQALTQPGTQSFFGIPLDAESDTPGLTEEQQPQVREALVVFDWLAGQAKGLQQVRAAAGAAQALALLGDYQQAIEAYQFAIHQARHSGLDEYFDSEGKNTLGAFIAELQRGLNEVRRLMDIKRYSTEFFLYRAADQQQRGRGNYKQAIEIYDSLINLAKRNRQDAIEKLIVQQLPPLEEDQKLTPKEQLERAKKRVELEKQARADVPVSPFSEAGRLNKFKCMLALDQSRAALKGLQQFIAEDELGLYRGESLMIVSTLAMDEFDFDAAEKWLGKLDAWIINARKDNSDWDFEDVIPGIRSAAKVVTDAPREETKVDFWGNIKKEPIAHGRLVNRKTCPWYLDDLEERCAKYLGFMKMAEGDGEAALEQFKRIIALDPNASDGDLATNPNDFTRLKFGCENGYLVAYPEDLELYSRRQRRAILWADMAYVTGQWPEAIERYKQLLDGKHGKLNSKQKDYPNFAIAQCILIGEGTAGKGRPKEAAVYFDKVVAQADGTISEYRTVFAMSKISRYINDEAVQKRCSDMLLAMAKSKVKNRWTARARLKVAVDLMHQEKGEEARQMLESIDESEEDIYQFAQFYLKQYEEKLK